MQLSNYNPDNLNAVLNKIQQLPESIDRCKKGVEPYSQLSEVIYNLTIKLHLSILSGENYLFTSTKDVNSLFDAIQNAIILLKDFHHSLDYDSLDQDPIHLTVNYAVKEIVDNLALIESFLKTYHQLCILTITEIEDYGSDHKSFQHYGISRIVDLERFVDLLNDEEGVYYFNLNIILAELDFYLGCSDRYIGEIIEVYRIMDTTPYNSIVNVEYGEIVQVMDAKCRLLLKKALSRRLDLDQSITYIDRLSHDRKRVRYSDLTTEYFNYFSLLADSHYYPHFDCKDLDYFEERHQACKLNITQDSLSFTDVHFICKYSRTSNQIDYEEKIENISSLYDNISLKFSNIDRKTTFDYYAYATLMLFILKTKLRIVVDELLICTQKDDLRRAIELNDISKEIHSEICKNIKKYAFKRIFIKDYYHDKFFLQAKLSISFLLSDMIDKIKLRDESINDEMRKDVIEYTRKLSEYCEHCIAILRSYTTNLKWSIKHNFIPLYLPLNECRDTARTQLANRQLTFEPFISSSYIRPVDYDSEKKEQFGLQFDVELIVTKLVNHSHYSNRQTLELEKNNITNAAKKEVTDTTKETKELLGKQISDNNIKSVQYLGIFSAMITLSVAALSGFKEVAGDLRKFLLAIAGVSTVVGLLVALLTLITVDDKIKTIKVFGVVIAIAILFFVILFFGENLQTTQH